MRNKNIDIVKGIGIILVVLGHTISPIRHEIYLFHMPLFFLVSGIFFKPQTNQKIFLRRKIEKLLVPYITFSILIYFFYLIFSIVFNLRFDYSLISRLLDVDGTISAPLWFFLALFTTNLILNFASKIKLNLYQLILSAILLNICSYIYSQYSLFNPMHVFTSLTCLIFLAIGFIFNQRLLNLVNSPRKGCQLILFFLLSFLVCSKYVSGVDYNSNFLRGSYLGILGSAISGSLFLFSFSAVISIVHFFNSIFAYLGRKSLIIFSIHLPLFEFARPISSFILEKDTYLWGLALTFFSIVLCLPLVILLEKYFPFLLGQSSFFLKSKNNP